MAKEKSHKEVIDQYNRNLLKHKILVMLKDMKMTKEQATEHLKVISKEGL